METYGVKTYTFCANTVVFGTVTMHFDHFILTILFKNAKSNIKKKKKKRQPKFSKILGQLEKGKQNIFF